MRGQTERLILVASLSLNLFLAAAFVAMVVWSAQHLNRTPAPGPLRLVALSLAPPHRQELMAVLRATGRAARPYNQQARALREAAWRSFGDANFDPAKVKAELAQARALSQLTSGRVQDGVIDFAAALPVDQRAALGRALLARLPPKSPGGKSGQTPPPAPATSGAAP
jgi:uncharacterized membrane protein